MLIMLLLLLLSMVNLLIDMGPYEGLKRVYERFFYIFDSE